MVQAAQTNAANWRPQCGDVIAVVLADTNADQGGDFPVQITCIEVPYPCVPCISVTKQVACYQQTNALQTNACGAFTNLAEGFAGVCNGVSEGPAFCYEITVTNCGSVPLTNITVFDNLLGVLQGTNLQGAPITNFFSSPTNVLEPGAWVTAWFSMSFTNNATNTVLVQANADLTNSVTNVIDGTYVVTNATPVAASDTAVALVTQSSISCSLALSSPAAAATNTGGNMLILPENLASPAPVTLTLTVYNPGAAPLSDVTITVPATVPPLVYQSNSPLTGISLPVGGSQTFVWTQSVSCPINESFNFAVTGVVDADATHCGVYSLSGNPINVCCSSPGTVECSGTGGCTVPNQLSGTVVQACTVGSSSLAGDMPALSGWTVSLYGSSGVGGTLLGTTITDSKGNYVFTNLGSGTYTVLVTPQPGYTESYPAGITNNQQQVNVVACQDTTGVSFGYANTTPPQFTVTPGQNLQCNPSHLPTDNDIEASNVTVTAVYCGAPMTNVTHIDSTNNCMVTRTFTIVVSDTYGNSATNYVIYSWTANTTPPTLTVPASGPLACNGTPPSDTTVSNEVTVSASCGSTVGYTVTHTDSLTSCAAQRVFTVIATDSCNNTATQYVTYTWTANTTPPTLTVPAGGSLACNATPPSDTTVSNGVTVSASCGSTVGYTVTHTDSLTGCSAQRVFTVIATDSCNNTATQYVTYTWTANTTPPTLTVPAGGSLACNATPPSDTTVSNGVAVSASCGSTVGYTVTHTDSLTGCAAQRVFTVIATDSCNNTATQYVTYTWTANTTPPALTVPAGGSLACNATPPSDTTVSNGVTVTASCGSTVAYTVTHTDSLTGCSAQRVFTVIATDSCNNTATQYVTYTWTANTTPPALTVPAGGSLACNATPPSDTTVSNGVTVTASCGSTVGYTVTHTDSLTNCVAQRVFTVIATDSCNNTATQHVTYTWTANTTPPALTVPSGGALACNATPPSDTTVSNGVTVTASCGSTVVYTVTHTDSLTGCAAQRVFTVIATDSCNNTATQHVTYTWTANTTPPALTVPSGGALACNATPPSDTTVSNGVTVTASCGSTVVYTVTHADSLTGCSAQRVFTVIATDSCNNTATQYVTYTWTANTTPLIIKGTPTNSYLGCNPTNLPTCASVTNGVTASNACGSAPLSVTNVLTTNGCYVTNTFTITAKDACGNTGSSIVAYSWLANAMPLTLKGTPTNAFLGCNPTNLPTIASVINGVTASNACGTTPLTVTNVLTTNGCYVTNTFTITAKDGCGNTGSATVVYSWLANAGQLVIKGIPTNTYLGCNPTNLPTTASVINGVTASNACGTAPLTVTNVLKTNGCYVTNTFTITAADACGNTASSSVAYSWTANTASPVLHGVVPGSYLGCNPASLPTTTSVLNGVTATAACGSASVSIVNSQVTNGCYVTNTFKITATDGCGNTSATNVVYSWLVNTAGPTVTCPPNVTFVTNICQMYCTFNCGDWAGQCNGGSHYNNNWWNCYCGNNSTAQCFLSFTNWWNSCGANSSQCSTWWNNWNTVHPTNWWGCWSSPQNGCWFNPWNNCNQGSQFFVPCAGNNPDGVLNNCFNKVYPSGCIKIGNTNGGNCVCFTSCAAAQTCLNWSGAPGVLSNCSTNPSTCSAGSFCAQVLALQLNCDFGDYGCVPGFVGKCGDLVLCNPSSPCNGQKVRDILSCCNGVLGGGACPQGCTVQYLCSLCSNLNQCFEGCQVSSWCSTNLCSVYIPTPAQTGTATVSDACSANPTLTYTDNVSAGSCGGTYVISRQWIAVDACGNSNTCTQTITVAQTNSCSVSGIVVLACSGDSNLSNNEGISGATVTLQTTSGSTFATTSTSSSGSYSFSGIPAGNYNVVVTPPSGYTETYPATSGNSTPVTLSVCENASGVNFSYIGSTVGVEFTKSAPSSVSCGASICYTFTLTNTGNTCETLSVVDPLFGGTIYTQTSVAPGQGFVFTTNYCGRTTNCTLTNTAWGIGTGPNGHSVTNTNTAVVVIGQACGCIPNGTYKIINYGSGQCLDVDGACTQEGTLIDQYPYCGNPWQQWTITYQPGGWYKIIGVASGQSLDIDGSCSANGTSADIWPFSGSVNQQFTITPTSGGYYRITPGNAPGSCVEVNGDSKANSAMVQIWNFTGASGQQWTFQAK